MSNIVLTTKCPRRCKYCFAKDNQDNPMEFQMGNFVKAIEWLSNDKNIVGRVGLLGGEPTAHPKFIDFLDYVLSKKINTTVFTNGMIEKEETLFKIIDIAKKNKVKHVDHLCFCINVNEQKYRGDKEQRLQEQFLKILGRVSVPSFNIFEESCNFDFLVDLINKYNMVRNIRFGLAAPLGNRNKFMSPSGYKTIAEKLTNFTAIRKKQNIKMGTDCGFPRCMFTQKQIDIILNGPLETLSFDCGPSIDIYPDLTITHCFPTSRIKKVKMKDYKTYAELYHKWEKEMKQEKPLYDDCLTCVWFLNNECSGGCKAHRIYG